MKKELKYFLYIITIFGFLIFVGTYYFSDKNKKNSYRSAEFYSDKLTKYDDNLLILKSDTENIIEYTESNFNESKKKYKFWELFENNEE
tara:strand:- start:216 stop:482 length:267 start_codon:yes stop_codon:yes gene_type:complete